MSDSYNNHTQRCEICGQQHRQHDPALVALLYHFPDQREVLRQMADELIAQLTADFGWLRHNNPEAAAAILRYLRAAARAPR